jgi:hypothetical protein
MIENDPMGFQTGSASDIVILEEVSMSLVKTQDGEWWICYDNKNEYAVKEFILQTNKEAIQWYEQTVEEEMEKLENDTSS